MSRSQLTILTNICLIEDLETSAWLCNTALLKLIAGLVMPFLEVMLKW